MEDKMSSIEKYINDHLGIEGDRMKKTVVDYIMNTMKSPAPRADKIKIIFRKDISDEEFELIKGLFPGTSYNQVIGGIIDEINDFLLFDIKNGFKYGSNILVFYETPFNAVLKAENFEIYREKLIAHLETNPLPEDTPFIKRVYCDILVGKPSSVMDTKNPDDLRILDNIDYYTLCGVKKEITKKSEINQDLLNKIMEDLKPKIIEFIEKEMDGGYVVVDK